MGFSRTELKLLKFSKIKQVEGKASRPGRGQGWAKARRSGLGDPTPRAGEEAAAVRKSRVGGVTETQKLGWEVTTVRREAVGPAECLGCVLWAAEGH